MQKNWTALLRDRLPLLTGIGFLFLCLWVTANLSLPLWQQGKAHQQAARRDAQRQQKIVAFARQYQPAAARDKKEKEKSGEIRRPVQDAAAAAAQVQALAERAQVQVRSCRPLPAAEKQDFFPVELALAGDYVKLLVFFQQWEKDGPLSYWQDGAIENSSGRLTFRGTLCLMKAE